MCGIFGTFLIGDLDADVINRARQATDALEHRGPDGRGDYIQASAGVYLGHRRLKIIDLSDQAHQPMVRDDVALSYNGEVYNFRDLRKRLEGCGYNFRSSGDTEVVLEAWRQWGPDCLLQFDGMFAFAIWDGQHGWLAVDQFSEKLLYYAETKDGIVFASELAVLAEFTQAEPDIEGNLPAFLTLGYIPSPSTIYPTIKRLEPGCWVKINRGQIVDRRRYWSPAAPANQVGDRPKFDASALDQVHEILVDNVASRLIADVPVCLFLSSGVDSSLIAAIIKKELNRDVNAITISFPRGATNDEGEGAGKIARALGLQHEIITSIDNGRDIMPSSIVEIFGQPDGNVTVASVVQMAKAARSHNYRVALTGLGGDELFFGYGKHEFAYRHRKLYNLPQGLRIALGHLAWLASPFLDSATIFRTYFALNDSERIPALRLPRMIAQLRQIPGFEKWCQDRYERTDQPFEYSVAWNEMMDTMVNSQLTALDLGSMRASMEFRTPFLSRKLSDFMAQWDWGDVMSGGRKCVLKKLLSRYLPPELADPKKMGLVFPMDRFLDQFKTPPMALPYLPQSLLKKIWSHRDEADWRTLATRMMLITHFHQEMQNTGRLGK
jgi:asparagine synthase (glutamine-hydrolysing)